MCLLYLGCELQEDGYGWCIPKLKCQIKARKNILGDKKTTKKYPNKIGSTKMQLQIKLQKTAEITCLEEKKEQTRYHLDI